MIFLCSDCFSYSKILCFRIPLMPRRPGSADLAALAGRDKKKAAGKKDERVDSPGAPQDPDERLMYEAYTLAVGNIDKIVSID